jgi:ABC-type uncharacterized transport system substrate-binding protein
MWGVTDPVGIGLIASLPRPGGNITGLSDDQGSDIVSKRLQTLQELAPKVSSVAALTRVPSAGVPRVSSYVHAFDTAGKALGLQLRTIPVNGPDDIDRAFGDMVRAGVNAVEVTYAPVTWTNRRQILDLAQRHRLPTVYWHRQYVVDGGLVSYGEDERDHRGGSPPTSTRSSRAHSQVISLSSSPPSSRWSSTSGPPKPSASRSRRPYSPERIRSSVIAAVAF